mgnify:CR=1 FL=1
MSLKKISKNQPENFEFTNENLSSAKDMIEKYPADKKQSAVMALLYIETLSNFFCIEI